MANYNEVYAKDKKFLSAVDIKQPLKVKIGSVEERKFENEHKLVASLLGIDKKFIINVTNAKRIGRIAKTEDFDEWDGVEIEIYTTTTLFKGEEVECLRVRAPGE